MAGEGVEPSDAPSLGVNEEAKPEKNRRWSGRAILQIQIILLASNTVLSCNLK